MHEGSHRIPRLHPIALLSMGQAGLGRESMPLQNDEAIEVAPPSSQFRVQGMFALLIELILDF